MMSRHLFSLLSNFIYLKSTIWFCSEIYAKSWSNWPPSLLFCKQILIECMQRFWKY